MWWWCLVHAGVEPDAGCAHQVRLGPFNSPEAAEHALATARERNEQWDAAETDD